jgi:hypothetical protein
LRGPRLERTQTTVRVYFGTQSELISSYKETLRFRSILAYKAFETRYKVIFAYHQASKPTLNQKLKISYTTSFIGFFTENINRTVDFLDSPLYLQAQKTIKFQTLSQSIVLIKLILFLTTLNIDHQIYTIIKSLKLSLLLFFWLFFFGLQAQTMHVRSTTGAQTYFLVDDTQKLTFLNGDLVVTNTSGTNDIYSLSSLRYLNFTDFTMGTEKLLLASPSFYVFPNPVTNILYLAGNEPLQRIDKIDIISLEGRLLLQQNQRNNITPQVDLSKLPQGFYLCKVTSETSSQTIKILKL